ncbi:N-acetyltransferase [Solirubrobacter taibaiensis]|nr:N-acetyltransferase [Solirubrobacter taibaiensis]
MTSVTDNEQGSRFELRVDEELVGWLDYRPAGDSIILAHTEVLSAHEGAGLGGVLVRSALEGARAKGKTVIATCPFAAAYIDRHPDLDEYLAPHARRRA